MPRPLSQLARATINAQETGEVFVMLLTLHHDTLQAPIRVCDDNVNLVSRGNTFVAFPFELAIGSDNDETPVRPKLTIQAVDRQIIQAVRRATSPVRCDVEVVLASQPDVVEIAETGFVLREVTISATTIVGELSYDDLLNDPYPADEIGPALFPGVFGAGG